MIVVALLWLVLLAEASLVGARGSPWSDVACLGAFVCFLGLCVELDR